MHDDGTSSNDDRLGAIGDMRFTVERAGLQGEEVLVVAGDNLIGYSVPDFVAFWRQKGGSAVALYHCPDPELIKQYGVVELDENHRIVSFEEKPAEPRSDSPRPLRTSTRRSTWGSSTTTSRKETT